MYHLVDTHQLETSCLRLLPPVVLAIAFTCSRITSLRTPHRGISSSNMKPYVPYLYPLLVSRHFACCPSMVAQDKFLFSNNYSLFSPDRPCTTRITRQKREMRATSCISCYKLWGL